MTSAGNESAGSEATRTIRAPETIPNATRRNPSPNSPTASSLTTSINVAGASVSSDDFRQLLQKRLRFAGWLFCAAAVVILLALWASGNPRGFTALVFSGVALVAIVAGAVGWACQPSSALAISQLRFAEAMLFGALVLSGVARGVEALDGENDVWELAMEHYHPPDDVKLSATLFDDLVHTLLPQWIFFILAYGILIPNTWRRCAAVIGAMAAIPCLLWPALGLLHGAPLKLWFPAFVMAPFFHLLAVSAISIYGCLRIEFYRQQAIVARVLGPYELEAQLGQGGMGEVYLARHKLLRRPCAVKLIRPEHAGNPDNLKRFEREVQITATLTHPNTVSIFDYGHADDGTFYYAMEYLPGLTLEDLVKQRGTLPHGRAIHFLRQICAALREAHQRGLIHRDIKPNNVMICERGGVCDVAKLLDFGLVLPVIDLEDGERLTQEGRISGTPAYLSPEQASARREVDQRSDIYSVGALGYFLLSGQSPFAGRSAMEMLIGHLSESPTLLSLLRPDAPEDLERIVHRCLAKKPEDRFQSVDELDEALAGCEAAGQWSEGDARQWWEANENG